MHWVLALELIVPTPRMSRVAIRLFMLPHQQPQALPRKLRMFRGMASQCLLLLPGVVSVAQWHGLTFLKAMVWATVVLTLLPMGRSSARTKLRQLSLGKQLSPRC